jgi:hypothetical protein
MAASTWPLRRSFSTRDAADYHTIQFHPNQMEKSVRLSRAFLVVFGVALAGCGSDNPNEPTVGVSGTLAFTYTGAGAANATQYTATGAIPSNFGITNGSQAWAAGAVDASDNVTLVYAFVPKGGNSWDESILQINRTTPGSSPIEVSCSSANCTEFGVWFGVNQNGTNYTYICTLVTGTVSITAISSSNATGTFSGSGTCFTSGSTAETPFTVTNGSFNVGLTALLEE